MTKYCRIINTSNGLQLRLFTMRLRLRFFIAYNTWYGIQCTCLHGEILTVTMNKLQSQSYCVNSPLEEDHALCVHHFDRKIHRSIDFFDQNLNCNMLNQKHDIWKGRNGKAP